LLKAEGFYKEGPLSYDNFIGIFLACSVFKPPVGLSRRGGANDFFIFNK
jgi:hypothetical protein